ncbi:WXG100 family type VII secretion target [Streptomyces sp. TRM75561]|uniref:WXG100 family type VII secretion target n=1 Tax=Streptomyces sp. TRM75561 TaxID=2975269 RepID=UPI002449BB99|nr:WXG100 family type VII secretion target [Streptomyces sp. TRM75561]MDH3039149.1 WXG100 family type VII secretion target [Streptomyces sp. TRM75561]
MPERADHDAGSTAGVLGAENVDYDNRLIRIDPESLGAEGDRLFSLAKEMSDTIKRINALIFHLRLGWVAATTEEVRAFFDRWDKVMTQMFGNNGDPIGVLPAMSGGVTGTAVGFSQLEIELFWMFRNFSNELAVPSGGDGSGPADRIGPEIPITQDYVD